MIEQLENWRMHDRVQSRSLAAAIENLILTGCLVPDARIPSERDLAARLGVSRTLVAAAYGILRDSGWIAARRGSQTRVSKGLPDHVSSVRRAGGDSNPFLRGHSIPDQVLDAALATALPDPAWLQLSSAAHSSMLDAHPYQPYGLQALREQIASHYERTGVPTSPQQILVTNGAQQALALVARRFAPNKRVLIEEPTYFGTIATLRAADARLMPIDVQSTGGISALEQRVRAGCGELAFVSPTAQNPLGHVWSVHERQAVVRAASASDTLLVVDDTIAPLAFDGAPPTLAYYAPDAPIVTIGSLSKTLWGGLRIGWLRADEAIVSALAADRCVQDVGSGLLSSMLACELVRRYDALLPRRRETLRAQRDACIGALKRELPDWRFRVPEGGPFLWIELPQGDADLFVQCAARHGVLLTPGGKLRITSAPCRHVRLSYTLPATIWNEAAARLRRAWTEFTGSIPVARHA